MNILGFDTATAACAACVVRADGEEFERTPKPAGLTAPPAHARELLPAIATVMEEAGLGFGDLDAIAVGRGPGGFTGLRIGIATARALAKARGLPVHPVSSLEAIAEGIDAPVRIPLIDARRGEVFAAVYRDRGEGLDVLCEPFVDGPEELVERLGHVLPAGEHALAAGDGSLRFRQVLEAAGVAVAPGESALHVVRALHVCRLAMRAPGAAPEAVVPEYLRAPDARPAR
jgi:tRNA threonylcarbamoyladenosine biosynthesis protein TsaB